MTRNKFFLTDYQEIDGGFVAFGESPKGGKIYGKCKIRTGKLEFEDVYFVKKLKFSFFSVSQMCDEKNIVLFTETECLVLSPNFKLLDENQVLLKVPRHNNMYSFDLKNVAPCPPTLVLAIFQLCYSSQFLSQQTDSSLFIFHKGLNTVYLLLYVDDIILTASSTSLMQRIISSLHEKFAMTDLGPLNYFLGISAMRTTAGIFMSQTKYATKILERAHMLNCNPYRTPVDTKKKLGHEGSPITDPTLYRSLAGALQYHTFTRPDFSYAVQHLGLKLFRSTTSQLITYSDADGAGCLATRRFNSENCSKHQDTLSRFSSEAEYRGVANCNRSIGPSPVCIASRATHGLEGKWGKIVRRKDSWKSVEDNIFLYWESHIREHLRNEHQFNVNAQDDNTGDVFLMKLKWRGSFYNLIGKWGQIIRGKTLEVGQDIRVGLDNWYLVFLVA
nr:ribonuclease H-like domain-containing protein [Tanacetum cinerariifolium]